MTTAVKMANSAITALVIRSTARERLPCTLFWKWWYQDVLEPG